MVVVVVVVVVVVLVLVVDVVVLVVDVVDVVASIVVVDGDVVDTPVVDATAVVGTDVAATVVVGHGALAADAGCAIATPPIASATNNVSVTPWRPLLAATRATAPTANRTIAITTMPDIPAPVAGNSQALFTVRPPLTTAGTP